MHMNSWQLTPEKEARLTEIVDDLRQLPFVKALVLGGSRAAGGAAADSDIDIGIYYTGNEPLNVPDIRAIAAKYDPDGSSTVTGPYEWGPWVNGGAWLRTSAGNVDFIYRNISQVEKVIAEAHAGIWENDFEQQPPYGFSSTIYLAETRYCIPLYDPEGIIARLKEKVTDYPPALKRTIIRQALWAAEFTLLQLPSFARKHDVYSTAGCLTRSVKNIVSALAAINEIYLMGDKRAITILSRQAKIPAGFAQAVTDILTIRPESQDANITKLRSLFESVCELAEGAYAPMFQFNK